MGLRASEYSALKEGENGEEFGDPLGILILDGIVTEWVASELR